MLEPAILAQNHDTEVPKPGRPAPAEPLYNTHWSSRGSEGNLEAWWPLKLRTFVSRNSHLPVPPAPAPIPRAGRIPPIASLTERRSSLHSQPKAQCLPGTPASHSREHRPPISPASVAATERHRPP